MIPIVQKFVIILYLVLWYICFYIYTCIHLHQYHPRHSQLSIDWVPCTAVAAAKYINLHIYIHRHDLSNYISRAKFLVQLHSAYEYIYIYYTPIYNITSFFLFLVKSISLCRPSMKTIRIIIRKINSNMMSSFIMIPNNVVNSIIILTSSRCFSNK